MNSNRKVIVVTGYDEYNSEMHDFMQNKILTYDICLMSDRFDHLHPKNAYAAAYNVVTSFFTKHTTGTIVINTNCDHVINTFRVLMREEKIDEYEVFHFNDDGMHKITCDNRGEFDSYPSGFLSEWSELMGKLV